MKLWRKKDDIDGNQANIGLGCKPYTRAISKLHDHRNSLRLLSNSYKKRNYREEVEARSGTIE